MDHKPNFRLFLLITGLLFGCEGFSTDSSNGKAAGVYIYKEKKKYDLPDRSGGSRGIDIYLYGLYNSAKEKITEPVYFKVDWEDHFIIAYRDERVTDIYTTEGVLLDSMILKFEQVSDTAILALFKNNDVQGVDNAVGLRRDKQNGYRDNPPGKMLYASGRKADLDKNIYMFLNYDDADYLVYDSNGKKGLMDAYSLSILVPAGYQEVRHLGHTIFWNDEQDFIVVDRNGDTHDFSPLVYQAQQISRDGKVFMLRKEIEGSAPIAYNYYIYKANGTLLENVQGSVSGVTVSNGRGYISIAKKIDGGYSVRTIMDTDGNYVIKNVRLGLSGIGNVFFTLSEDNSINGLINIVTGEYMLRSKGDEIIYRHDQRKGLLSTEDGSKRVYYDGNGNIVAEVSLADIKKYGEEALARGSRYVKAFRSSPSGKFKVYNQACTKKYEQEFEAIGEVSHSGFFAGKIDGKWGVYMPDSTAALQHKADADFQNLIPPEYDTIKMYNQGSYHVLNDYYKYGYYKVSKGDKAFWIDGANKVMAGGRDYDMLGENYVEGKTLAYQIKREDWKAYASKVFIVDSSGDELYSLDMPEQTVYHSVHLLTGDRIFFEKENNSYIKDAASGKMTELKGLISVGDESVVYNKNSVPLAVVCRDEDDEEGVYSFASGNMIVPVGKYSGIRSIPYLNSAVVLYGIGDGFGSPVLIGTIDKNGVFYE